LHKQKQIFNERKPDETVQKHHVGIDLEKATGFCSTLLRSTEKTHTQRARITLRLQREGLAVIEVHPLPTRKALEIAEKDWREIQKIIKKVV